jgi:hypothetical protein
VELLLNVVEKKQHLNTSELRKKRENEQQKEIGSAKGKAHIGAEAG